jgi:chromosome segregation ATPase
MPTTTDHDATTIATRLEAARAHAADLRAQLASLDDDERLALYESRSTAQIKTRRAELQTRVHDAETLIAELERRLPAEQYERLLAALDGAIAAETAAEGRVKQSGAAIDAARASFDKLAAQHDALVRERDQKHNRVFALRRQIDQHRTTHPQEVIAHA